MAYSNITLKKLPSTSAYSSLIVDQFVQHNAKNNSLVPIVENKPLARALYATVEVDEVIPPELYQAVAEILAVVYTERNKQVS